MKKIILIICLLVPFFGLAQSDYKVVFDLTSRDTLDHKALLRWVNEISKASSDAKVEVVMYGQGVHMVKQGGSPVEPMILKALQNKNVSFKVCAVALKNQGIAEDQLLPGVGTVPDGIYEIILKQKEGWGYIKAVH
jgi:uncharacterized protein